MSLGDVYGSAGRIGQVLIDCHEMKDGSGEFYVDIKSQFDLFDTVKILKKCHEFYKGYLFRLEKDAPVKFLEIKERHGVKNFQVVSKIDAN